MEIIFTFNSSKWLPTHLTWQNLSIILNIAESICQIFLIHLHVKLIDGHVSTRSSEYNELVCCLVIFFPYISGENKHTVFFMLCFFTRPSNHAQALVTNWLSSILSNWNLKKAIQILCWGISYIWKRTSAIHCFWSPTQRFLMQSTKLAWRFPLFQ